MFREEADPSALGSLLSAYAANSANRYRLIWALDARLAQTVRTTSEPLIGQIRLAWWQEALTDPVGLKGRGEPLVDAMRAAGLAPPAGLTALVDGWEAMIGDLDLDGYALGRGGGLFQALTGEPHVPEWLTQAGAAWALWDLSGHVSDDRLAGDAIARGRALLLDQAPRWPAAWRPLRLAYALARHDIIRGRQAPRSLTPGLYLRLLRLSLFER